MDIEEAIGCMNSDFKLWSNAEDKELGGGRVEKTLDLPWGIGKTTVIIEGVNDADKRRAAVSGYGEYIRGLIKERIDDEAITSRAKAAAGRPKQGDSEGSDSPRGSGPERVREPTVQEADVSQADEAHKKHATRPPGLREILTARKLEIDDEVEYFTTRRDGAIEELISLAGDLRAVEAGLDALGDDNGDQ